MKIDFSETEMRANESENWVNVNQGNVLQDLNVNLTEIEALVANRGAKIIELRGLGSAISAAKAICDHMCDWFNGSDGRVVNMGVFLEDGNELGLDAELNISVPVICAKGGAWKVAPV
jgi:malate/lactate dehydrogenase